MKVDMTVEDAAKMLRGAAELTMKGSQNWDNYEMICRGVLNDALAAGRKFGLNEAKELPRDAE